MKCNAAIAALMLAMGLSTPSFGANLLDQMLGLRTSGRGCCATSCQSNCCPTACCDTACAPACGHEAAYQSACGCDNACCPSTCGCDRGGLLGLGLLSGHGSKCCPSTCGCDTQACCPSTCGHDAHACCPSTCGHDAHAHGCCQDSCCQTSCCKRQRTSLLDMIFGNRCRKSSCNTCDSCCGHVNACGCGGEYHGAPSPAVDDGAPVPPAPMVDPAAYVPAQRRVVHAGVNLLR